MMAPNLALGTGNMTTSRIRLLCIGLVFNGLSLSAEPLDCQRLLDEAVSAHQASVTIPPGIHRVKPASAGSSYHVTLKDLQGFTIIGDGATLVFENPRQGGLYFDRCRNVTVRGLTLDWDPLPFTQGRIEAIGKDGVSFDVKVDPGYGDGLDLFGGKADVFLYDPETRHPKRGAWDMFGSRVSREGNGILRISPKNPQIIRDSVTVGTLATASGARSKMALRFVECAGITVDRVTVLAAPGMAIQEALGDGGSRYSFTVTPGPAPTGGPARLLSSTADAFHSSAVHRGPVVEHCLLEGQGDDAIAIHGAYSLVTATVDTNTVTLSPKHKEMPYRAGDRARLYDGKTFTVKSEAVISRITRTDPPAGAGSKAVMALWQRYRDDGSDKRYYTVSLDRPVKAERGDLFCSPDALGSGFTVHDNTIRHHRGRGILVKACDGVIEGNRIEGTTHAGISLGPEFSYWLEGDFVRNVTVRNNVLRDVGIGANCMRNESSIMAGAITVGAASPEKRFPAEQGNRGLVIEGNRVESTGGIGMMIACAQDVQVRSNRIGATCILGAMSGGKAYGIPPEAAIYVAQSSAIRLTGNDVGGGKVMMVTNVTEKAP